jgi:hypothetical protein
MGKNKLEIIIYVLLFSSAYMNMNLFEHNIYNIVNKKMKNNEGKLPVQSVYNFCFRSYIFQKKGVEL